MTIFTKIEENYPLRLKTEPVALTGGFLHKMYRLETEQGVYALKILNPFIMKRETAMENFARAERLEVLLEKSDVPILPALSFDGKKMQELEGAYFYLFPYYAGKSLKAEEITACHCRQMGRTLARIHGIDRREEALDFQEMGIDWDFYLSQMKAENGQLCGLLQANYELLVKMQEKGNQARKKLPAVSAICHNDMDCKNVLWDGEDFRIIDLECLAYNNPLMELFELALCWSGFETCKMDFGRFRAFLDGYCAGGGELPADWETLYDSNTGRLEWLEYNLKRVLGIDCGAEEKETGIAQAKQTLEQIAYYGKIREEICRI